MCKYCEETSCLSEIEYNLKGQGYGDIRSIIGRTRFDVRPEDNLFQIDTEVVALVEDDEDRDKYKVYGEWSEPLDINYCPMCGKKLRQE